MSAFSESDKIPAFESEAPLTRGDDEAPLDDNGDKLDTMESLEGQAIYYIN